MNRQGQSTVEYILLVSAVVAVVIFMTTGRTSVFQKKLTNTVTTTMNGMEKEAQKLTNAIGD